MSARAPTHRRPIPRLLAALPLLLLAATAAAGAPPGPAALSVSVVPNRAATDLRLAWAALLAPLAREAGVELGLRLHDDLPSFLEAADAGRPDLLYAPPNVYFEAHRRHGYVPLVHSGRRLAGVLFVRKDSPIRRVEDLEGRRITFVGPRTLCAVITRHALATAGRTLEYSTGYAGSARRVATMVATGEAEVGAVLDVALATEAAELTPGLRTLLETPAFAPHPLAAHPRVPVAVRERITRALLDLAARPDGRRLLADVRLGDPVLADHERDYMVYDAMALDSPGPPRR